MRECNNRIEIKGQAISAETPHICVPIVGETINEIVNETEKITLKNPDLIEWRADYFLDLAESDKVIEVLTYLRNKLTEVPILFTIRSEKEGGQPIKLSEQEIVQLMKKVCESNKIDILDFELRHDKKNIQFLRSITEKQHILLILSYHNFERTPDHSFLLEKCHETVMHHADIVKLAVMAKNIDDVLSIMNVTNEARKLVKIPLITMSMGQYGAITRMLGWTFGSAITFAIGDKSSAPGQIPIDDLRSVIAMIKKSI